MLKLLRIILPVSLVILLAMPAGAHHCTTYSTDQNVEFDSNPFGMGGPRYYIDNDVPQVGFMSLWIYEESNGIDGLQRGDEAQDDTCHGLIEPDTVLF